MGKHKWDDLGISYPLENTLAATDRDIERAENIFFNKTAAATSGAL
jgi:hypothetical protein